MNKKDFFFWLTGFLVHKTELSNSDILELKEKLNNIHTLKPTDHVNFDDRIPDSPDIQVSYWDK